MRALPISEYPEVVPPSVVVRAQYPGRESEGHRRDRRHAARGGDQRRRGHALHGQPGDDRRRDDADRHLQARHRPRQGAAAGAEPRRAGRAAAARGSAPARRDDGQELARPDDGRAPRVAERALRHDVPAQLRDAQRQGPARARSTGVGQVLLFGSGDYSMRVWLDPQQGRRARPRPPATWCARSASRTCRPPPAWSARRRACPASTCSCRSTRKGRLQSEEEFGDIIVKTGADGAVTRLRDVARLELGASDYALRSLLEQQAGGGDADLRRRRARTRSQISDDVRATMAELKKNMPEGVDYQIVYDPTQFVRASIDVGGAHAARGGAAGRARRDPVPADLARVDHPAAGGAGVDRRHVRGDATCSASRSTR